MEIDHDLYNRQIYVLGDQAMHKLAASDVLLCGVGALGVEIAKNIVLAGIKSLTIVDDRKCSYMDLGYQFFVQQKHIDNGMTRSDASMESLRELNPNVKIEGLNDNLKRFYETEQEKCLQFLCRFKCVILTEVDLSTCVSVNNYCRANNIMFIMTDVVGLTGWCFTDFTDTFEVTDLNGEEPKEQFIGNLSKSENAVVETCDNRLHDLETGDHVRLSELEGYSELNGQIYEIKVLSPTRFQLTDCNTSVLTCGSYTHGGVYKQIKKHKAFEFHSLASQLYKPDCLITNYAKMSLPYYIHACLLSLEEEKDSYENFKTIANDKVSKLHESIQFELIPDTSKVYQTVWSTRKSKFPSLCAVFGGIIAQEALKSVTNKFTPIKQWLHLDCIDLYEPDESLVLKQDRYDVLRICFGSEAVLDRIKNCKLFMVGCGAIGCEMLKNFALLGVACDSGLVTITDNDIIEKSNLNRQFLFRPEDIRKPKSVTAAQAIQKMNSDVNIKVYQEKVCPQTEKDIFTDKFFESQHVCVNALDNIEARRYMDSRCVTNQISLLESGTLGAKAHVQVIIPHLSESYTTQRDPQDEDVPYCTLKSFPSNIEHCIQWARDKFESSFTIKPNTFKKFFLEQKDVDSVLKTLETQQNSVIDGSVQIAKIMRDYCFDWTDCLKLARLKFEKYFSNKAKNLLYVYPLDHCIDDSMPFWKLPKRPPHSIHFDVNNELHLKFATSCARLYADLYGVATSQSVDVKQILTEYETEVPQWTPSSSKKIVIDEKKSKDDVTKTSSVEYDNTKCAMLIRSVLNRCGSKRPDVSTLHFEKDHDSNGHIDFIYAAANLRACMYSIENSDRLKVKKIAGKIVPAIATTTACVAGFVSIELVKAIKNEKRIENYNNVFINLGLSMLLISEPGPCQRTQITQDCSVTLWDKWYINGGKDFKLREFIAKIKEKYHLTVSGVINGSKAIYIPVMPGHAKRLNETMLKLIKGVATAQGLTNADYIDLTLTYAECDEIDNGNRNNLCPPVRYYFI